MGHLARLLEEAEIATVIIAARAFRKRLEALNPPRVLITVHPMGRPVGKPGDPDRQRQVVEAALKLIYEAKGVGAFVDLPEPYSVGIK